MVASVQIIIAILYRYLYFAASKVQQVDMYVILNGYSFGMQAKGKGANEQGHSGTT
jgi:hypothetical protein